MNGNQSKSFTVRPNPIYAFGVISPLLIFALCLLFFSAKWMIDWFGFFGLASFVLSLTALYKYFYIRTIKYKIEKEVLKISSGILSRRVDQLELYRVRDLVMTQSMLMRIFRLMTIKLYTKDLTSGTLSLSGIPLSDLDDVLRELVKQARLNNNIYEIN